MNSHLDPLELPHRQLDLFLHSSAQRQLIALQHALLAWRLDEAESLLAAPASDSGSLHWQLAQLLEIARALPDWCRTPREALAQYREHWSALITRCFGAAAAQFSRPLLSALARALEPEDALSAAELWLELEQPEHALSAIEDLECWEAQPAALVWHARISEQLGQTEAALADWQRLCVLFPEHAETALPEASLLAPLWLDFCDLEPALETWLFPAWAALQHGTRFNPHAAPDPLAALLLLAHGTTPLARRDPEFRRHLQAFSPTLFQHWLANQPGAAPMQPRQRL